MQVTEARDDRVVRDATAADASACAAIYAPYVTDTTISFEATPPDAAELRRRIEVAQARHAFLVLEEPDGQLAGYAYGGLFRERAAYRFSCEVSVYLAMSRRGSGGGRRLYEALLARLAERGFRTVAAGVTQPNDASARLHTALGFEPVGTYSRVGYKLGQWLDVAWYQRAIGSGADAFADASGEPPTEPR
ncbi:GCN5 family acetyltransferase [Humibacillus sp. DSM 29435]|uniref:GNAT family N-acetyltransferase n=1 Tax=Humibacillus sp. DSM 29435 TaxID=1869167 RepID=UPI000871B3FD|nr:GNAT family N-acetyltransferase [Humibacillus sp. DSM 29435]OFE16246.1 GCN5 family acetyltransferase [Humibacillus sp. DSM 29435]